MKVRLVGGPFGGQVKDVSTTLFGRNQIIFTGPKRLTRQEKMDLYVNGIGLGTPFRTPHIEAIYQLAMRAHTDGQHLVNVPCQHPDGSLFYEYVRGSKRDR